MFITEVKRYKSNGIIYVGGVVPNDAEVLETMNVLCAEKGFKLERKSDKKRFNSVWLKDGDIQENYEEREVTNDDSVIVA